MENLIRCDLCLFFSQMLFRKQANPHISESVEQQPSSYYNSKYMTRGSHPECSPVLYCRGCSLFGTSCPFYSNKWLNRLLIRCKLSFQYVIEKQQCRGFERAQDILKWNLANKVWAFIPQKKIIEIASEMGMMTVLVSTHLPWGRWNKRLLG